MTVYKKDKDAQPLVSVIVPVYNSESILEKCIYSVVNQTWKNLEIIIINDGSKDGSADICDRLIQIDERIHVIHQTNSGVSYARNIGVECARGEYIIFLDSDDVLPENSISVRVSNIGEAGMLVAGYQVIDYKSKEKCYETKIKNATCTQFEMLKRMFGNQEGDYQGYLWNKIFRTDIIKKYGIKFNNKIYYNEDRLFIVQYLKVIEQIRIVDDVVYHYQMNPNGAMESAKKNLNVIYKKWITEFEAYRQMSAELKEYDITAYYECNIDAMYSAISHRKELSSMYKKEKEHFSECIREFSKKCITNKNYSIMKKLKLIGHYILAR